MCFHRAPGVCTTFHCVRKRRRRRRRRRRTRRRLMDGQWFFSHLFPVTLQRWWSPALPLQCLACTAVNVWVEARPPGSLLMHMSLGTKADSVCERAWVCVCVGGEFWGLPGCRRGDQRPQVTSDLRTHEALQEEPFECGGYGCRADACGGAVRQWRDNRRASCCRRLRW